MDDHSNDEMQPAPADRPAKPDGKVGHPDAAHTPAFPAPHGMTSADLKENDVPDVYIGVPDPEEAEAPSAESPEGTPPE